MYIDFHTHQTPELAGTWTKFHGADDLKIQREIYLSRGLHPWGLSLDHLENEKAFKELIEAYKTNPFYALGETGFDRYFRKDLSLEKQEEYFFWHYEWAVAENLPMILHIVHAHDYFLKVLKKIGRPKTSMVIHDFRSSRTDLKKYLNYPLWFSFGKSLLGTTSKTPELLSLIPEDRFFLETDGEKDFSIGDIYLKASVIRNIDNKNLQKQMQHNFHTLFPQIKIEE